MNFKIILFQFLLAVSVLAQGNVYIVMGSDTGIWEGLNVNQYIHNYKLGLYTDQARNAYKVMDLNFRRQMLDSYGTPLKMTWWMMSGNTFRYAKNNNVPEANSMTFYLMNKYHGDKIKLLGDEISLHYHTFTWTDYDNDGIYYWNQALAFEDFIEDFEYTLAQNLIDENVFPVSYRSGWHYMDNEWQNYLENILPFSMHNDYPHKHTDDIEPLDNLYNWSQAPSEFVPYHPASDNYQIPGNLKGYELRSVYMTGVSESLMNRVFQEAQNGKDQVVCIWAHLPETDFLDKIQNVHEVLRKTDENFSDVKFRYCSGIEAMQRWLGSEDKTPPEITIEEQLLDDELYLNISTTEPIFQDYPFVAVKDIYKNYKIIPMEQNSENNWSTSEPINLSNLVKIGVAAIDNNGNLSTKFIKYLTDDKYIDNEDVDYTELIGNWENYDNSVWQLNSRITKISPNDSAKTEWKFTIDQSTMYSILFQIPETVTPVSEHKIELYNSGSVIYSKFFDTAFSHSKWNYISTRNLKEGDQYTLLFTAYNNTEQEVEFVSDVIKITPIVREKEIVTDVKQFDFGSVSQIDTIVQKITINNMGIKNLYINNIYSHKNLLKVNAEYPFVIEEMGSKSFDIQFHSSELGKITDTLFIISDDPVNHVYKIPVTAIIETPFFIVDNENIESYKEFGEWNTSVAQAYSSSSRYSVLNQNPRAYADFNLNVKYKGAYKVQFIVPKTVNASDNAVYYLLINNQKKDSVFVDQNLNSGNWIDIFTTYFNYMDEVTIRVKDTGETTVGPVLRADAVKFKLLDDILSSNEEIEDSRIMDFVLHQNYPNPFNPSTLIEYSIPQRKTSFYPVELIIYDVLGNKVTTLVKENQTSGNYRVEFNSSNHNLSSGVYFYYLQIDDFIQTKKMILLK